MPISVTMPRLSDTMEEGTLVKWRVKVGDSVKSGDVLADVETDKATMELQAYDEGTVAALAVGEGQIAKVGVPILILAQPGEKPEDAAKGGAATAAPPSGPSAAEAQKTEAGPEEEEEAGARTTELADQAAEPQTRPTAPAGRVRISPLADKMAAEHGLDVSQLQGTGPDGRIIKRDILAALEAKAAPRKPAAPAAPAPKPAALAAVAPKAPAPSLQSRTVPLTGMRKTIAKRLLESKQTIPHYTVTVSVSMDALLNLRETLNQQLASQGIKLSVTDFLLRAVALSLVQHPMVNSSWAEEGIQQHGVVNLGMAVSLPEERGGGLIVPVLHDAQNKGLRALSLEARSLAEKARTQGLSAGEMADGTFTVSNLGMYGVDHFEAIINPPQAAILAVGAALAKAVVRNGQLTVGQEMTLTLSADHRVVDGATGAAFLQTLRQMLENPAVLLV